MWPAEVFGILKPASLSMACTLVTITYVFLPVVPVVVVVNARCFTGIDERSIDSNSWVSFFKNLDTYMLFLQSRL
jgi:hypothetical protein